MTELRDLLARYHAERGGSVGETEADASKARISYNSPIGRALIGRKVDEEVEVSVPAGDRYYLVSKIEFI